MFFFFFKQKTAYEIGLGIPAEPLFRSKVMRHTLGASLNIRHNLSSSKGPKPLQLKLLTTYIPKTSAFTLAFSTVRRAIMFMLVSWFGLTLPLLNAADWFR